MKINNKARARASARGLLLGTAGAIAILASTESARADCGLFNGVCNFVGGVASAVGNAAQGAAHAVGNAVEGAVNAIEHTGHSDQPAPVTPAQEQKILAPKTPVANAPAAPSKPAPPLAGSIQLDPSYANSLSGGLLTAPTTQQVLSRLVTQGALSAQSAASVYTAPGLQDAVKNGVITQAQADRAAKIISEHGAGLIGQDGAGLIGQDGAGLIGQDGAGLIGQDGAGLTKDQAKAVAKLIGQDGAGLISEKGGGLVTDQGAGVISHNGGNAGSTVVSNDGGSVIGHNGSAVISHDGGTLLADAVALQAMAKNGLLTQAQADNAAKLLSEHGAGLIGQDGAGLIGQDGAGLTAAQAKTVAALIGQDGAGVIGHNGSAVISNDGSTLVGNSGGTLVSTNGGNTIAAGGGNVVGHNGSAVISNDGSTVVSNDGGSLLQNANALINQATASLGGSGVRALMDVGPDPNVNMARAIAVGAEQVAQQNVNAAATLVTNDRAALDAAVANKDQGLVNQLATKLQTDAAALNSAVADYNAKNNALTNLVQSPAQGETNDQIHADQLATQKDYAAVQQVALTAITNASNGLSDKIASVSNGAYVATAAQVKAASDAEAAAAAAKTASDAAFAAICSGTCERPTDPAALKKQNDALADAAVLQAKQTVADQQAILADMKKSGASQAQLDAQQAIIDQKAKDLTFVQNMVKNGYADKLVDADVAAAKLADASAALAAFKQAYGGKVPTDPKALAVYNSLLQMAQVVQDKANAAAATVALAKLQSQTTGDPKDIKAQIDAQNAILNKAQSDIAGLVKANPGIASLTKADIGNVTSQIQAMVAPAIQYNADQQALNDIQAQTNAASAAAAAQGKNADTSGFARQYQAAQSKLAADQYALSNIAPPSFAPTPPPAPVPTPLAQTLASIAANQAAIASRAQSTQQGVITSPTGQPPSTSGNNYAAIAALNQQIETISLHMSGEQGQAALADKARIDALLKQIASLQGAAAAPAATAPATTAPPAQTSPVTTGQPTSPSGNNYAAIAALNQQIETISLHMSGQQGQAALADKAKIDALLKQIDARQGAPAAPAAPASATTAPPAPTQAANTQNPSVATLQSLATQYSKNAAYAKSIGDTAGAAGWQKNVDDLNAKISALSSSASPAANAAPAAAPTDGSKLKALQDQMVSLEKQRNALAQDPKTPVSKFDELNKQIDALGKQIAPLLPPRPGASPAGPGTNPVGGGTPVANVPAGGKADNKIGIPAGEMPGSKSNGIISNTGGKLIGEGVSGGNTAREGNADKQVHPTSNPSDLKQRDVKIETPPKTPEVKVHEPEGKARETVKIETPSKTPEAKAHEPEGKAHETVKIETPRKTPEVKATHAKIEAAPKTPEVKAVHAKIETPAKTPQVKITPPPKVRTVIAAPKAPTPPKPPAIAPRPAAAPRVCPVIKGKPSC